MGTDAHSRQEARSACTFEEGLPNDTLVGSGYGLIESHKYQ